MKNSTTNHSFSMAMVHIPGTFFLRMSRAILEGTMNTIISRRMVTAVFNEKKAKWFCKEEDQRAGESCF